MAPRRAETESKIEFAQRLLATSPEFRSKRRLQSALKAQYPTGLRDVTLRRLVGEAKDTAIRNLPAPQGGFQRPKNQRQARYNYLVRHHFLPAPPSLKREGKQTKGTMRKYPPEAWELSKLKKNYPALRKMVAERQALWNGFIKRAINMSPEQREKAWRSTVMRFYRMNGYYTKPYLVPQKRGRKVKLPSPWEWYDKIFGGLPPSQQVDTPKSHRRKPQPPPTPDRLNKSARINNLLRMARDPHNSETQRDNYRRWARELQGSLRS